MTALKAGLLNETMAANLNATHTERQAFGIEAFLTFP